MTASGMAGAAKAGRNRAVDAYRAVAMIAVALGHWMVMVAYRSPDGEVVSGNGLEFVAGLRPATWLFQVMPLFFMVGGFASAASLDSKGLGHLHTTTSKGRATWIAGRMARLLPPVSALAITWLVLLAAGAAIGITDLVATAAIAAAIPLWFLANYTADVILAPHVLPLFRRNPALTAAAGLGLFLTLEGLRLATDNALIGALSQANWIIGWFLFQVIGFAWRDGRLPTGARLVAWAGGLWVAAVAAVTFGPWSVSMVHFPGIDHSPTHPPTLALLIFGAAQSATAIIFAPRLTAWLERSRTAWTAVVAANSMAMTIYLWHMTAGVLVTGAFDQLGLLSDAVPGSVGWFLSKIPFVIAAAVVLGLATPTLSRIERDALLSPKADWDYSPWLLVAGSIVVSFALKGWTASNIALLVPCAILVVAATATLNRLITAPFD